MFLVRKGNPKQIHDWPDLLKPGVAIITPNPKTSGGARWNYLAAWGFALKRAAARRSDEAGRSASGEGRGRGAGCGREIRGASCIDRAPVLDSGARGATNTFVQREIGDVLLAWENEALLAIRELGPEKVEIVVPSVSILAEPPVAVVDTVVDRRGTRQIAEAYLRVPVFAGGPGDRRQALLPAAQSAVLEKYREQFAPLEMFTVDEVFGGWTAAHDKHFEDGGVFDKIYGIKGQ